MAHAIFGATGEFPRRLSLAAGSDRQPDTRLPILDAIPAGSTLSQEIVAQPMTHSRRAGATAPEVCP